MSTRTWQILWLGHLTSYDDIFERDLFTRYRDVEATHIEIESEGDANPAFDDRVEQAVAGTSFDLAIVEGDEGAAEILTLLRDASPALPVMLIADPNESARIAEAFQYGIDEYVIRTDDEEAFRELLTEQAYRILSFNLDPPSTLRPTASELLRYAHYYNVLHPFFVFDHTRRLRFANQAGREFTREAVSGDAELVIGDPLAALPLHEIAPNLEDLVDRALAGDEVIGERSFENLDGDSSLRELFYRPVLGEGGRVIAASLAIYIPMHPELRAARRHAALGRLAASVAHDFNNVLSVVATGAAVCRAELDRPDDAPRDRLLTQLEHLDEAVETGGRLTSSLLSYTGRQALARETFSPTNILERNREFLQRMVGEDVVVSLDLEASTPEVEADPGQFEQVLMNLVANARDAMPTGGTLHISTREFACAPEQKPPIPQMRPGLYAELTVADTGEGMEAATADSAFEPCFSTRSEQNFGLGLATVKGIVEQSRGYIDLESEPGRGTTVTIYLPASESVRSEVAEPTPAEDPASPTVLITEDEEALRVSLEHLLSPSGCEVHLAASTEEALEIAAELGELDLLLTDIMMPGKNGFELVETLEQTRPDLDVIFMSGYSDEVTRRYGEISGDRRHFVQKPFDPTELVDLVEELLERNQRNDGEA